MLQGCMEALGNTVGWALWLLCTPTFGKELVPLSCGLPCSAEPEQADHPAWDPR